MIKTNIVAKRIAYFLKKNKISQQALKNRLKQDYGLDVSQATISNWTIGVQSPGLELGPILCEIFDISITELFSDKEGKELSLEASELADQFKIDPEKTFHELLEKYNQLLNQLEDMKAKKRRAEKRLTDVLEQMKKWNEE